MRKITKTLILVLISTINFYSQTGEVVYGIKSIKQDNLEKSMVKGIIKEYDLMKFSLVYNKTNSYFRLKKNIPHNSKWYNLAKIFIESYNDWYQNPLTKEASYNQEIGGELYHIIYNKMDGWEVTEETKNIEGYTCYKAIRKESNTKHRNPEKKYLTYIAWFTPDIPAPYGPLGNGGLPGLILQLEKPNLVVYTAKKIVLNKKNKVPVPKEAKKINPVDKHKLMRLARKYTKD